MSNRYRGQSLVHRAGQDSRSDYVYDVNGHLASATDAGKDGSLGTGDDIRFQYTDNAQGIALRREQIYGSTVAATHGYLYLNGQGIGDVGNDGDRHLYYAQSLAQSLTQTQQSKTEQYKNWQPIASADFDQNYQPINADHPGATSSRYTAQQGDTLQSIARAQWGDASLWYLLADANGLSGGVALKTGQVLTVPNKITNVHNNSTTFRPYEAGRIIGNTSPTLPDAPPAPVHQSSSGGGGGGCGGVGAILVAIVVVVVAVVIQAYDLIPAAVSELGAGASAAYTAGVANVAGQAVGNAVGVQDGFSWSSLATAVVGGYVTAGLDVAGTAGVDGTAGTMLNAAAGNVLSQGLNLATGQQKQFSWSSLAASMISATIAPSLSRSLLAEGGALNGIVTAQQGQMVQNSVLALASATTRLVIQGGRLQWEAVAADLISGMIRGAYAQDKPGAVGQQANDDVARQKQAFDVGAVGTGLGDVQPDAVMESGLSVAGGGAQNEASAAQRSHGGQDIVRVGNGDQADVEDIIRAKRAAYERGGPSDPLGRSDGIYQGNDVWSYPVADNRIESRALPELVTGSGSLQGDPGLLSNLGGIGQAYLNGRVGFADALQMANGQIGGIGNVVRDTLTGTLNGLIAVPEFAGNIFLQGTMPGDPGYVSLPKFAATGRTGSLQSDIGMLAPVLLGVRGSGAVGETGELAGAGKRVGVANTAEISTDAVANLARPVTSPSYSVVSNAQLKPGTYTASDANHFRQANRQLYDVMQEDASLASRLESNYPGITNHVTPGPRGGVADTSPPGLTWHHDPRNPGQLQLIPRDQHQAPGPVQSTLHPQQQGGRELWGGGR